MTTCSAFTLVLVQLHILLIWANLSKSYDRSYTHLSDYS